MIKIINLLRSKKSITGRDNYGHLVCTKLGGGFKKFYRIINFLFFILDIPKIVLGLQYDPNRNSILILICYKNGYLSYNLGCKYINIGSILIDSLKKIIYNKGDALALKNINIGVLIYNLSNFNKIQSYTKAGGTFSKILIHKIGFSLIELKSGEFRLFNNSVCVNIGIVLLNMTKKIIKAGTNRNLGIRPTVRGVAKNPVDHPNGGSASGGKLSRNKWSKLAKGGRTYNKKLYNKYIIKKRFKDFF